MRIVLKMVLVAMLAIPCQAQKKQVELNLIKGETYYQKMNSKMITTQPANGQTLDIFVDVVLLTSFKVIDMNDSIYDIEVSYKSMYSRTVPPTGDIIVFDSEKETTSEEIDEATKQYFSILTQMLNKPFYMKLSKKGQIKEVTHIEELLLNVLKNIPEELKPQTKQYGDHLENLFGEVTFKGNFEMASIVFPSKDVFEQGKEWITLSTQRSVMPMGVKTTYTLKKEDADYYYISGKSIAVMDYKFFISRANDIFMKYTMDGNITSDIQIDKKTGWVHKATILQNIIGNVYANSNKDEIPMKIKTQIEITDK